VLTQVLLASASPDYVRQDAVRVLHYRAPSPGIGVRLRYRQVAPTPGGGVGGAFWSGPPLHGNSYLLTRPWARRVESLVSVGVGSSTLDYRLTDTEISLWVPGDSVSVDCSLTHHYRWHRGDDVSVPPVSALRTDPRTAPGVTSIPPVVCYASAWHSPVPCTSDRLRYVDSIALALSGGAVPISIIPPWARSVNVYPSNTGTAVNWTFLFLWPYSGLPIGQQLSSTLQQASATHYTAAPIPVPPGAVFCAIQGITQPVLDWTFVYGGEA